MKKWLSPHHSRTVLLIAFHLIHTFAAWRFSVVNGGDAAGYWFLHEDMVHGCFLRQIKII